MLEEINKAGIFGLILLLFAGPTELPAQAMPGETPSTEGTKGLKSLKGGAETTASEIDIPSIPESYIGRTIFQVSLSCDLPVCRDPVRRDKLKDLTGLFSGSTLNRGMLRYAKRRLQKTGYFNEIRVNVDNQTSGLEVGFVAVGATFIRKIELKGFTTPPFESDLRKLLIYRKGEPFREDKSKKQTQLASLKGAFRKDGYFGTNIELKTRPVEDQPNQIDLIFKIEKGRTLKICKIGFRGINAMDYQEAKRHLLSDYSFLIRRLEVSSPNFRTKSYERGKEALLEAYRRDGYFRARIVDDHVEKNLNNSCARILVDVKEGPRWTLKFEGNREFPESTLEDELPFYQSGYVDAGEIERAERRLEELYETRGYPFAQVKGQQKESDRLNRQLVFRIEEGQSYQINDIRFLGNKNLSRTFLLDQIQTSRFQLFESGGYLQTQRLLADLKRIEKAYHKRGFLYARVVKYDVKIRSESKGLELTIFIEEGQKTYVSQLRLSGNRELTDHVLSRGLNIEAGDSFVPIEVRADRSRILQKYSARGYPMAEVETTCRNPLGEKIPCERPNAGRDCRISSLDELESHCRWDRGRSLRSCYHIRSVEKCNISESNQLRRVRIEHSIKEGPLVYVGAVFLRGNFDTQKQLIRREIPLEAGDEFNVKKLLEGQSNLRQLGIFDSVSVEAIGLDEYAGSQTETTAGIIVSVDEGNNRYIDFRAGLEGRDVLRDSRQLLLTGEMRYTNKNLLGTARRIEPRLLGAVDSIQFYDWATRGTSGQREFGFSEIDYLTGVEFPLTNPRFLKDSLGVRRLTFTITPFYTTDLLGMIDDRVLREEWGLRLDLRKELTEITSQLYASFGIEGKQAALWSPSDPIVDGERLFRPRRTSGKLIPELTFDRRNSPLNPTRGYFLQLKPELISGATLARSEEQAIDDAYMRFYWNSSFHTPLMDKLILSQNLQVGQIVPFFGRSTMVSPDERFYLGGMGTVRGFPADSLGPIGRRQEPTGGQFMLNYTFEMRYPLLEGVNLWGATFIDTGLLADCFRDGTDQMVPQNCYRDAFNSGNPLEKLRSTAGLGVRFLIANQIPLVFDYGVVLDRRLGEPAGNLDFNIGYTY